jgi:hypothetical protein
MITESAAVSAFTVIRPKLGAQSEYSFYGFNNVCNGWI